MTADLRSLLELIQRRALIVSGVALLLGLIGAIFSVQGFLQSYLYAFFFWIGLALGSLAFLFVHHMVWGKWGYIIRRPLEAAAMVIPLMAVLFLPILFGIPLLYEWARPEVVAGDALLQAKEPYLNVTFFVLRAIFYFAVWIVLAVLIYRWSTRQDETGDPKIDLRFKRLAPAGAILYFLTMTFAAFDWGMSLEPHWFSGIYGVTFIVGQGLSAMAFAVAVVLFLSRFKPFSEVLHPKQVSDLGNFMLAFTLLWAYVNFSQFLIIWSGNIGEDNIYYLTRMYGGWRTLGVVLILFHFFVPFFILLSRRVKRNLNVLVIVAGLIIFMRFIDLFWVVVPSYHRVGFQLHWLDPVMIVAIGGLWLAAFIWWFKDKPLLPKHDPKMRALEAAHD